MDREKYQNDIRDIKDIMERSSRFLSLSGLSGILVGIVAIVAAFLAQRWVLGRYGTGSYEKTILENDHMALLLMIAVATMVLSIGGVIFLTTRETRKRGQKAWDFQTRRILINLGIPLLAGGVISLIFLFKGLVFLVPPLTMVFYGLALVNASKYTVGEIRSLGLLQLILGLIGIWIVQYGIYFWALGFGFLHIVYGIIAHRKYNS